MSRILVVVLLGALTTTARADAPATPTVNTIKLDRVIVQDAMSTVEADTRDFNAAVERAEVLRQAWHRAIDAGDVKDAGRFAMLHAHALRDVRITHATLERHRDAMYAARQRLIADEFVLQHPDGVG